ncbi:MAG: L-tyrosine/L-tryptophan isonitrile synthase family protein [Pseudoruegeria sp.]
MTHQTKTVDLICSIIGSYLVRAEGDKFDIHGKKKLTEKLEIFLKQGRPIELVLPGFPFKSPASHSKTSGQKPDLGEVVALQRIEEMCKAIVNIYPKGVSFTIVSDGTTFNDIIGVSDDDMRYYRDTVQTLLSCPHITWASLTDLVGECDSPDAYRAALIEKANLPYADLNAFIKAVSANTELRTAHDSMCSFLYNDLLPRSENSFDEDAFFAAIREKSYQMTYRHRALSAVVANTYPEAIRLSVHQYTNSGEKLTFGFDATTNPVAPWHKVTFRKLDGSISFVDRSHINLSKSFTIYHDDQVWMYQESDSEVIEGLHMSVIRPPQFGLDIKSEETGEALSLSPAMIKNLTEFFSFLCLRNCGFEEKQPLVDYCEPFGDIYQWHFGSVHVVQAEENPKGFVQSIEKTPIHWDLSMLPQDHERVKDDEWFCADLFMLYCKTAPQVGEGETVVINGRDVLSDAGPETVEQWRGTEVTYNTKMTYFGGHPRTYPLIHTHPFTKEPIFRYMEGSNSQLQTFTQKVEGISTEKSRRFIEQMNALIYSDKYLYEHSWEAGDMIVIDNHLTLHGRNPMTEASSARELWRVQIIS